MGGGGGCRYVCVCVGRGGGSWRGGVRTKLLVIRNIIMLYFRTASLYFLFLMLCYTVTLAQ